LAYIRTVASVENKTNKRRKTNENRHVLVTAVASHVNRGDIHVKRLTENHILNYAMMMHDDDDDDD